MKGAWRLGGLSWKELIKRVAHEFTKEDVGGEAAKLAFYSVLALFPLLLFMTALSGSFSSLMPCCTRW